MALNFPNAPTVGQTYTSSGKTWRWTGAAWSANTDVFSSGIVNVSGTNVDCSLSNYFTKTVSANTTFTFSNAPSGVAYSFTLEIDHTSGTITWPASVKWPGNTAPTLISGKTHLFVFVTDDGGSRWRGGAIIEYTT